MAQLPLPGRDLTAPTVAAPAIPAPVRGLLERLWDAGHAAYVVGGSLRDVLLGREPADWDLATDARPDRTLSLFPNAAYDNRFGTVAVRVDGELYEITTFRKEHDYADFRRPHRIEFGDSIEIDLGRRDFTVNAMAWGADAPARKSGATPGADGQRGQDGLPADQPTGRGHGSPEPREAPEPRLVDPFGGAADVASRIIRAVGDPVARFDEDALRMIRAVRLAAVLDFTIEPATFQAIRSRAGLAAHLSGERVAAELGRLLAAPRPSVGLDLLARSGLLDVILPELAAQEGIPQNKIEGEDLWAHTLRSVDAVPPDRPVVRLAALLHDVGKPVTWADGRFVGHDAAGAEIAATVLARLRAPRALRDRVVHLIRHHMFSYEEAWSDAAVRRFIARVGRDAIDELLALREADNAGSGRLDDPGLAELRQRIADQLAAEIALDRSDLAIDGRDLIEELGVSPGPRLGRLLDELLERVMADPRLNDRPTLLLLAQAMVDDE